MTLAMTAAALFYVLSLSSQRGMFVLGIEIVYPFVLLAQDTFTPGKTLLRLQQLCNLCFSGCAK